MDMNAQHGQSDWEAISAWRDGELSAEEADRVATRVRKDPVWAAMADELTSLHEALGTWDAPAPPAGLADRIVRSARPRGRRWWTWATPLATAAAILVAITVGYWPTGTPPTAASASVPEEVLREGLPLFHESAPDGPLAEAAAPERRWSELTDEQRQAVRKRAMAFLQMEPSEQQRLLAENQQRMAYPSQGLRREQLRRVQTVIESFSPAEQAELRNLPPAERMERFLQRRQELIAKGVLPSAE